MANDWGVQYGGNSSLGTNDLTNPIGMKPIGQRHFRIIVIRENANNSIPRKVFRGYMIPKKWEYKQIFNLQGYFVGKVRIGNWHSFTALHQPKEGLQQGVTQEDHLVNRRFFVSSQLPAMCHTNALSLVFDPSTSCVNSMSFWQLGSEKRRTIQRLVLGRQRAGRANAQERQNQHQNFVRPYSSVE